MLKILCQRLAAACRTLHHTHMLPRLTKVRVRGWWLSCHFFRPGHKKFFMVG